MVTAILLVGGLLCTVAELLLAILNLRHTRRHAHEVPAELRDAVDASVAARATAYSVDRNRARLLEIGLFRLLPLVALWSGLAGRFDRAVSELTGSFITQAVVYVLGIGLAASVLSLPFRLHQTFVIEARHGFNRMTFGLFVGDMLKGALLSALFGTLTVAAAAWLVVSFPSHWWLLVWAFLAAFSALITLISPHVIEPLFFKVRPLAVPGLEAQVHALAERAGVRIGRIFEIDASRRSGHSNAYFTGLGPVKRVVLFDTLLERMNHPEILAVLAHELGHWKRRHLLQRFALGQLLLLINCYLVFRLVAAPWLPGLIGEESGSLLLRATIVFYAGSQLAFLSTPLFSAWSRRHEWEADEFARNLGAADALASGLKKLARSNLANLFPHPWFVTFYASHPTVLQRIRRLRQAAEVRPALTSPSESTL